MDNLVLFLLFIFSTRSSGCYEENLLIVLYQFLDLGHLNSLFIRRDVIYYGYSFILSKFSVSFDFLKVIN